MWTDDVPDLSRKATELAQGLENLSRQQPGSPALVRELAMEAQRDAAKAAEKMRRLAELTNSAADAVKKKG